jgi:hypothetical protein
MIWDYALITIGNRHSSTNQVTREVNFLTT